MKRTVYLETHLPIIDGDADLLSTCDGSGVAVEIDVYGDAEVPWIEPMCPICHRNIHASVHVPIGRRLLSLFAGLIAGWRARWRRRFSAPATVPPPGVERGEAGAFRTAGEVRIGVVASIPSSVELNERLRRAIEDDPAVTSLRESSSYPALAAAGAEIVRAQLNEANDRERFREHILVFAERLMGRGLEPYEREMIEHLQRSIGERAARGVLRDARIGMRPGMLLTSSAMRALRGRVPEEDIERVRAEWLRTWPAGATYLQQLRDVRERQAATIVVDDPIAADPPTAEERERLLKWYEETMSHRRNGNGGNR